MASNEQIERVVLCAKAATSVSLLVSLEELDEVLAQQAWEALAMPLFDPTRYRNEADQVEWNGRFLVAFAKFRRDVQQLLDEPSTRESS
jgi:hypothetical protein